MDWSFFVYGRTTCHPNFDLPSFVPIHLLFAVCKLSANKSAGKVCALLV
jgi:hypothetical protein